MDSREVCIQILDRIYENNSIENLFINTDNYHKLSKKDQSLVNMIVLTFLRRNGEVDHTIRKYIKKPLSKKSVKIKNILRIGITQILFLDIPDFASVNNCVSISKKRFKGFENLVNAILRNVCREKNEILKNTCTLRNLPNWIKIGWEKSIDKAKIKKISNEIIKVPKIDINIKEKEFRDKDWKNIFNGETVFNTIIRSNEKCFIEEFPFFREGKWWIQNAAASIPCFVISKLFSKKDRKKVYILEIGSAPGGKTMQLCDFGFNITTVEKSLKRIKVLKQNLQRMKFKPQIINNDIKNISFNKSFDCCLIDAPCTASGTIQRNPEILLKKKNIASFTKKQSQILECASKFIKKDGFLLYVVCSLIYDEGEGQIKKFLKKNKNFKNFDISKVVDGMDCFFKNGSLITTPINYQSIGGLDGFFVSCLKRIS